MWPLALVLALALAPNFALRDERGPKDGPSPPSADAVKSAVAELKQAFAKGKPEERVSAIERAAPLAAPEVVEWIAKGLKETDAKVQGAALEALRHNPHPDALAALLGTLERDKKLAKHPELGTRLVKAIGQHRSAAAVEKLASLGLDGEATVVDARILAIANVRSVRSVELLIELARGASEEKVAPRAGTLRLALARLVGEDLGPSRQRWQQWWSDSRKTLELPEPPPPMSKDQQLRWDGFWGNPYEPGRAKARGDRGKDPEGKGGQ